MSNINPIFKRKFCADDFGFSPSVNDAIIDLAKMDLLYSVSIAVNAPYILHRLDELLELKNNLNFFLHLNLTYGKSLAFENALPSFNIFFIHQLISKNKKNYSQEIEHQIKKTKELNIPIVGIDGHQHVHLFPYISREINNNFNFKNLFFRKMVDKKHFFSYLFSKFSYDTSNLKIFPCGYLLKPDLKSFEDFQKKCLSYKHVIIHPAKYNDFSKISFKDKLKLERIQEFEAILKYAIER